MGVVDRLQSLVGVGDSTDHPYVCRSCGGRLKMQYHQCPECGGYHVDRDGWSDQ